MQVGGAGSVKSDINITPLVDVVLVLLIIFMVLSPVVQMGYLVKVPPKAPPVQVTAMQEQIVVRFMKNNQVFINKEEMNADQFPNRIREILRGNTSKMVFFSGDSEVKYEDFMHFLDKARGAGVGNIGIIVEDVQ